MVLEAYQHPSGTLCKTRTGWGNARNRGNEDVGGIANTYDASVVPCNRRTAVEDDPGAGNPAAPKRIHPTGRLSAGSP